MSAFEIISVVTFVLSFLFANEYVGCGLLIVCQIAIFAKYWREHLNSVASFVFMYCLFFAVRPIYLLVEHDHDLLIDLFYIRPDLAMIYRNLAWASVGIMSFVAGSKVMIAWAVPRLRKRISGVVDSHVSLENAAAFAVLLSVLQLLTLGVMIVIGRAGRNLYEAGFGAYAYDLPNILQGFQVFTTVFFIERFLARRSTVNCCLLVVNTLMFLLFVVLMRNVSLFRGFYITGLMIVGLAAVLLVRRRVSYGWLVLPVFILLPFFQWLGQNRAQENSAIRESIAESSSEIFGPMQYWTFFDSSGDMNIFDTFIAASETKVAFRPYLLSWLYVPVHFVPRKIWKGKPENGVTQDLSFANGAPYSPGISGFFIRDGGRVWMVLSMFVLGAMIMRLDLFCVTTRIKCLRCCVFGILVVNAMFLTRFFLWQYVYQVLYTLIPCLFLAKLGVWLGVFSSGDEAGRKSVQNLIVSRRKLNV